MSWKNKVTGNKPEQPVKKESAATTFFTWVLAVSIAIMILALTVKIVKWILGL